MSASEGPVRYPVPPVWRIIPAFILAPAVPAFLHASGTLYDGIPNGSYLKTATATLIVGGYLPALLVGLPLLLVLKGRVRPSFLTVTACGGLISSAPWALLALLIRPDGASMGGHQTVIDGQYTLWGWIELGRWAGEQFLLGAIGGAAFWLIAVAGWRPVRARAT